MKIKSLILLVVTLIGHGCTTMVQYNEMIVDLTLRDNETKRPIENLSIYFLHIDPFGDKHRYGPFITDSAGKCQIEVPNRTFTHKGISSKRDQFEFEVQLNESKEIIVQSFDPDLDSSPIIYIKIHPNEPPNQAFEAMPVSLRSTAIAST